MEEQRKERLGIEDKTKNEKIENHAVYSQKIERFSFVMINLL